MATIKQKKIYTYDQDKIKSTLSQLRSIIRKAPIQSLTVTGYLITDQLVKGMHIHQPGLEKVKRIMNEKAVKIIFVPLHRSMIDIVVHQFVNILHNIEFGFTFIPIDDMPMKLFLEAFKQVGAVYVRFNDLWNHSVSYGYQSVFESIININKITIQNRAT